MTNLELRILSGLHRGAALPLIGEALELGGAEHCDVVLADRGLAQRHARLSPGMEGWRLDALDGEVCGEFDVEARESLVLAPGARARLGEVWVCLSAPDMPWQAAPEPAPVAPEAPEAPPLAPPTVETPPPPPRLRRRSSVKRLVLLPFGIVIVLCAATAYAFNARPETPPLGIDIPVKPAQALPVAAAAQENAALSGAALRAAFERELADGQMLERFELQLNDARWEMRADLDGEEKERFERILKRFIAAHGIGFPVDARIVPSGALLPFRIQQVLSGAQAGVVTEDGHRLFVGDEYRGTRLVSMKDGRLVFAGKRKIEVQW